MKKICKVVLILMLCIGLVGCSSDEGKNDNVSEKSKSEEQKTESKQDKVTISSEQEFFDKYKDISETVILKNLDFKSYLINGDVTPYDMGGLKFLMAYTDNNDSIRVQYIVNDDIDYTLSLNTKNNTIYRIEVDTKNGIENERPVTIAMIGVLNENSYLSDETISAIGGALLDPKPDIYFYGDNFIISTTKNDEFAKYSVTVEKNKPL